VDSKAAQLQLLQATECLAQYGTPSVADGPVKAADWSKVAALLLMSSWAWLASAESANAATMKVLAS